ncbi:unnamed protein product [Phyllotreta striolata]|uniref:Glycoside hydrolase family 1 n=1 Tax=Phyllotreta striolata TaxID=444603 RepID=A0A9N9TE24_PHYSR|nr:unnamed protein product [Phyllotreta striolata]
MAFILRTCLVLTLTILLKNAAGLKNNGRFPNDFLFGVSTASYQIEGAWLEDGKGLSVWDEFVHRNPSLVVNNDTGDVACDSYHRFREDVHLTAGLGVQLYRFSISWARLFPDGYVDKINQKGLRYYKNLIQEVIRRGLKPVVTLFHWDLPLTLFQDGLSWTNPALIDIFTQYAKVVIENFPEVSIWITFNEPRVYCRYSYGEGVLAPGLSESGILDYQCTYVLIKAHAAVYRMYKRNFPQYQAPMSIVVDCSWYEPETKYPDDIEAGNRAQQFTCGMYLWPIFNGDWPKVVKDRIAERSYKEGYTKSRLPQFTPKEIEFIKGTYDYLGINHYSTFLTSDEPEAPYNDTDYGNDIRIVTTRMSRWGVGANNKAVVPWGVRKVLVWLKETFGDQKIFITEIGLADNGTSLDDYDRIDYYSDYYCEILEAMQVYGVDVFGISTWSLMDNFEWTSGYSMRFGLYAIDFYNDITLTRRPKKSVEFYKKLTKTRQLDCRNYNRVWPPLSWGPYGKEFFDYKHRCERRMKRKNIIF